MSKRNPYRAWKGKKIMNVRVRTIFFPKKENLPPQAFLFHLLPPYIGGWLIFLIFDIRFVTLKSFFVFLLPAFSYSLDGKLSFQSD